MERMKGAISCLIIMRPPINRRNGRIEGTACGVTGSTAPPLPDDE